MSVRQFHLQGQHDQASHAGGRGKAKTDERSAAQIEAEAEAENASILESLDGWDADKADQRAAEIHATAKQVEPEITQRLASLIGDPSPADYSTPGPGEADLYGYAFRLKSQDKIAEKIGRIMVEDNVDFDTAAADIKDAVRYTAHFSEDEFGQRAQSVIDELRATEAKVKVKNTWPPEKGVPYKGVNVQVTRPDGVRYELQMHTPRSQAVKDKMHELYVEQRVLSPSSARWQTLEDQMKDMGNTQPMPRDAARVFRIDGMTTT